MTAVMSIWLPRIMRQMSVCASATAKPDLGKSYEEAVKTLNTLQSNSAVIEKIRKERDKFKYKNVPETIEQVKRAGIQIDDVEKLNLIHVSGTKGKGSTCAYCECILRSHGYKTGFFSSPHLVEVRERIRINGKPLSREAFSSYFWDCYRNLEDTKADHGGSMPAYFRFLTIMACHVFIQEKVDVAILEVGIGGQYDSTNFIRQPVVCGVSSLGLDHTAILGDTIEKIAWNKAGIFKPGVTAFTVPQPENSSQVLIDRAKEIGNPLYMSPSLSNYDTNSGEEIQLGIAGEMQKLNASLALQLTHYWMDNHKKSVDERHRGSCTSELPVAPTFPLSDTVASGLKNCQWPGRNQTLIRDNISFFIDGAHTSRSITQCIQWFSGASEKEIQSKGRKTVKVLLFNSTGDRDIVNLLEPLAQYPFDCAVFCPNIAIMAETSADQTSIASSVANQLEKCKLIHNTWLKIVSETTSRDNEAFIFQSINQSLEWIKKCNNTKYSTTSSNSHSKALQEAEHIQILCTGSLHLVGGLLGLIDPDLNGK